MNQTVPISVRAKMESTTDCDKWLHSMSQAIRDPAKLISMLGLSDNLVPYAIEASKEFPLIAPLSYVARMERGNPKDPLLMQILPLSEELIVHPNFQIDPVGDLESRRAPGLLHKYQGRALLILTSACAVHCRYCFRRHYSYQDEPRRLDDWEISLRELDSDPTISEVILSGGDPLMLSDSRLAHFVERLAMVAHVRRLRIHTRLPIVLPDRITNQLLEQLTSSRLTPIMVVHANHPQEVTGDCEHSLRRLVQSGITTLNQSVLLRGINDNADTLVALSERLINVGVIPYYLHQLDRVQGASHFEVDSAIGKDLINQLRKRLPGYAVPKFVREVAGEKHKVPL